MRISKADIDLLLDALARGAARHESLGAALKAGGYFAGEHDRKAAGMRNLRTRLLREKVDNPNHPTTLEVTP